MADLRDSKIKFFPGAVLITPGAQEALNRTGETVMVYLCRHLTGDWGELCETDCELNERAIGEEARILSSYLLKDDTKLWIITEADRSATTLLLPEEY